MLVDAGGADRGAFDRAFDACVIGAGPAGITLARRLAAQGYGVALMEGGGLDLEPESQALYEGEVVGLDYYRARGRAAADVRRHLDALGRPLPPARRESTSCPAPTRR